MRYDDPAQAPLAYLELGWTPVAAATKGKIPIGAWKRWQTERPTERAVIDMFPGGKVLRNVFLVTGDGSRLAVLDCDGDDAKHAWALKIGEEALNTTARVQTPREGGGEHFYYRTPEGLGKNGRSGDGWDLRLNGGGVVAPPSVHPNGGVYKWVLDHGPDKLKPVPEGLIAGAVELGTGGDAAPRSLLSHLLSNVPDEGGRNMWLSKVAGHYARHIPHQDAYEMLVRESAAKLAPPLPENEIRKMLVSIWGSERAKTGKAAQPITTDDRDAWRKDLAQPTVDTGWLASGGNHILVQVRKKVDDHTELALDQWLDCDLRAIGLVSYEGNRTYEVEVRRPDGTTKEDALPAAVISSSQALPAWLAGHGASIGTPDDAWPARMREGARLLRYLEAQKPTLLEAVPYLGWHSESAAFITHDGIIRADGPAAFENVRPHPSMKNWAKYRYGHTHGLEKAREVLGRVLEFHDETVAAVFGAWWAAVLLKPQVMAATSQFPFMALEAASESGKTTGYFNLMLQLSGYHGGQTNPTVAALRDALSAHRSASAWLDDQDDVSKNSELLRNVTVGGSHIKKGENNHEQVTAVMRAALVVSGEGLGLHGQKALLDRAILLNVPSPTARVSRSGRPQWEDIQDLKAEFPDLTDLAGSVVQLALQQEDQIKNLKGLRVGSGRFADKNAIVRLGARILAAMVEENWMVDIVDDWVARQKDPGAENALTLQIIPEVLAVTGRKDRPDGPDEARRLVPTPVFVQTSANGQLIVWFSPLLLEQWLQRNRRQVSSRLETRQSMEDQARALQLGGREGHDRKPFKYSDGGGKSMYWRCPADLSADLLSRSEGFNEGESNVEDDEGHLV